ncbi:MAG: hypothetical protein DWQ21_07415 [Bacteroidetes bacterium]|nr:MAG: hypothetical protein DWQ21_07415 [Bacteroidota bacterium]REK64274.1 MAG: hypothetical protein DWQ49_01650 [Bacteroidota bacterium]
MRKAFFIIIGICATLVMYSQPDDLNCKFIEDARINISNSLPHVGSIPILLDDIDLNLDSCGLYLFNVNSYSKAELRRGVRTLRILPIIEEETTRTIVFVDTEYKRIGKRVSLVRSDSYRVEFRRDENDQWVYFSFEIQPL